MAVNSIQRETATLWWEVEETSPGVVALTVSGELDLATARRLEGALMDVEATPLRMIVIDLRPLEFIDLAGARSILAADERARAAGRALHVVAGPRAERLFTLAQLDGLSLLDA
jgi:anti-sigma B factor antagonist